MDNGDAGSSGDASLKSAVVIRCGRGGIRKGFIDESGDVGESGNRFDCVDPGEFVGTIDVTGDIKRRGVTS